MPENLIIQISEFEFAPNSTQKLAHKVRVASYTYIHHVSHITSRQCRISNKKYMYVCVCVLYKVQIAII